MSKTYQIWTREGPRELTQVEWWTFDRSLLHRTDGPAVITPNGLEVWYQNGQLHRTNGPAVIHPDGTECWFLNDQELPKDEVESWINTNDIDLNRLEDQLMFLTEWGSGWAN